MSENNVPSPFLPNSDVMYAWDATSIGLFKTCPRLYWYQIVRGFTTLAESIHLRWGIEYHHALESYDRFILTSQDHDDALRRVIKELHSRVWNWTPNPTEGKRSEELKTKAHLVRAVIWYLDQYSKEDDPAETMIFSDGTPAVEVNFKFELDWGPKVSGTWLDTSPEKGEYDTGILRQPYILCGYLDRVVIYQEQPFVMDRKTTTSTPGSYFFEAFDVDTQMTLYTIAGQIVLQSPIRGVMIDACQVAVEFSRNTRGITYRSKDQIAEWLYDLRYFLEDAERCATENYWRMNDSSCGKFGGCRFRSICSMKSPTVREKFLKSNFIQLAPEDRWNPLKPRV